MSEKRKTKMDPDVFRNAATAILCSQFSYACYAVSFATHVLADAEQSIYHDCFHRWFKPNQSRLELNWWEPGDKESRIIALLLMADILETEGADA